MNRDDYDMNFWKLKTGFGIIFETEEMNTYVGKSCGN